MDPPSRQNEFFTYIYIKILVQLHSYIQRLLITTSKHYIFTNKSKSICSKNIMYNDQFLFISEGGNGIIHVHYLQQQDWLSPSKLGFGYLSLQISIILIFFGTQLKFSHPGVLKSIPQQYTHK